MKFLHWLPRILAILFILFISMFALDVFEMEAPWWQILGGFLIHLIPSFVLIAVTVAAWKKELLGGLLFVIAGLSFIFIARNDFLMALPIITPPIVIGLLFELSYFYKKRRQVK